MSVRKAHGSGANALIRVETPPIDEMNRARTDGRTVVNGTVQRDANGRFTSVGAKEAGRLSGQRRRWASQLADHIGLDKIGPDLRPYLDHAVDFARTHLATLTELFGPVGPGPSSMVQSAALALAASRKLYADATESADPKLFASAARLADQSRQALLTAHHLAELEGKAREATIDPYEAVRQRIMANAEARRRNNGDDH